ncbi:MAG: hypothetical protein HDR71_00260 [Lachnospiraceae bacterium]|nr:hypothetical protein [Lachnospiraceae bacterium]
MAGTSVKEIGSFFSFAVNQGAASSIKAGSTNGFGDAMSKASYSEKGGSSQNQIESKTAKELNRSRIDQSHPHKDALRAGSSQKTEKPSQQTADQEQAAAEAGRDMIRETAEEFGVSEEEVVRVMEELGLGVTALLDSENLTKLALALSGEESSLALLTDAELYGKVQNLLQDLEEVSDRLMEELSLNREEFAQMLEGMNAGQTPSQEMAEISSKLPLQDAGKGEDQVTVTVEEGSDIVKFTVDENGNAIFAEKTAKEEAEQDTSGKQDKGNAENESKKQGLDNINPMLDTLPKNQAQGVEAAFEQMTASAGPDTNEIMNQILDHMKIHLKPGMDQLEMQLHPASLGTLHVQLTSKGGEITAQFHVQNETVKAAIESQLTILKDNLKDLGVRIEAVEVTVESHAFESNLWQGQQRDENGSYQESKKTPRRINLNALEEGFEEEADEQEVLAAEMMRANGGTVDYTV